MESVFSGLVLGAFTGRRAVDVPRMVVGTDERFGSRMEGGLRVENSTRIQVASRRCRLACTVFIVGTPVATALLWFFFNELYPKIPAIPLPVRVEHALSPLSRFLAFLAQLPPTLIVMYQFVILRRLFGFYEKGKIFAAENVECYRRLGWMLMVWVGCEIAGNSLLSVALTLGNPPGQRVITLGVSSAELASLFIGSVVLVVSWVMDEGRKIAEEQSLFV